MRPWATSVWGPELLLKLSRKLWLCHCAMASTPAILAFLFVFFKQVRLSSFFLLLTGCLVPAVMLNFNVKDMKSYWRVEYLAQYSMSILDTYSLCNICQSRRFPWTPYSTFENLLLIRVTLHLYCEIHCECKSRRRVCMILWLLSTRFAGFRDMAAFNAHTLSKFYPSCRI
jgi:hypothetical protein